MKTLFLSLMLLPAIAFAGVASFPQKEINPSQLSDELVAAGYTCRIAQGNRIMVDGVLVMDSVTGRPKTGDPYVRIACNEDMTGDVIGRILNNHVPIAEPVRKTSEERRKEEIRAEATVLLRELGLID